jgi:pimeloyl-ACP methyl ester carboxylesterase
MPILERMRGPALAFDLPGFGRSGRPSPDRFDYSMRGYARFVERALAVLEVEEYSLVVHDWGGLALIGAQRDPDRVRRVAIVNAVPLLPGYRWHRIARIWRRRGAGELLMRMWSRPLLDHGLREARGDWSRFEPEFVDLVWSHLDHRTKRAILTLYRSAPPKALEAAGRRLGALDCPALVVWAAKDRYLPPRFGRAYAEALPGAELLELPDSGHWPWRDEPEVIPRFVDFLEA